MDDIQATTRFRFTLRELYVVTAVIGGLLAMIVPALRVARAAVRQHQCVMNNKMIAIAFHNYHDVYRTLPASRLFDEDQEAMHSFRVLLLPYLESNNFYRQYRFAERWDGPSNTSLAKSYGWGSMYAWACPSSRYTDNSLTNYVTVNGPGTLFPADNVGFRFPDIPDGNSNTLLVGETAPPTIHWLEPRDLEFAKLPLQINSHSRPCLSGGHRGGVNVAMADGSVRFLLASTSAATLRSYLLIDDGAEVR